MGRLLSALRASTGDTPSPHASDVAWPTVWMRRLVPAVPSEVGIQDDDADDEHLAREDGPARPPEMPAERPAEHHDRQPWQDRISDDPTPEPPAGQQQRERHAGSAAARRESERGEGVAADDESKSEAGQPGGAQAAKGDHGDQTAADRVENLEQHVARGEDGRHPERVERDQQDAPREDEAVDGARGFAGRAALLDAQREGRTGQEDERRGTEMREPARQELRSGQRRARPIERRPVRHQPAGVEHARRVVDRHQNHDEAPEPVQGEDAGPPMTFVPAIARMGEAAVPCRGAHSSLVSFAFPPRSRDCCRLAEGRYNSAGRGYPWRDTLICGGSSWWRTIPTCVT